MTVPALPNYATFTGNGTTGPFSFSFPFLQNSDLTASVVDSSGSITSAQIASITGAGSDTGGSVTLVTALIAGSILTVYRSLPAHQQTQLPNGGPYFAVTVEAALDYLTMLVQQLQTTVALTSSTTTTATVPWLDPWLDARAFATLAEADAAALFVGSQLLISSQWDTVPATLSASIRMLPGGKLNNVGSLTITGDFQGCDGCFIGSGSVAGLTVADVRWMGAKLDYNATTQVGTDDTAAIQKAATAVSLRRGDIVGRGGNSKISNVIVLPQGVSLKGGGWGIYRTHSIAVANSAFDCVGDNLIEGITYDGGSDIIAVSLGTDEFVNYNDFNPGPAGNIIFRDNTFNNSCGGFIVSSNTKNITIVDNIFGDYLDHAIYFAGRLTSSSQDILISGNKFMPVKVGTVRECLKTRNGVYRYTISNNTAVLPYAAFVTLDSGDATGDRDSSDINIIGNTVSCYMFLLSRSVSQELLNNINVSGNTVDASSYMIELGTWPNSSTDQAGTGIDRISITSNSLRGKGMIINGQLLGVTHNGIETLVFTNNDVSIISSSDTIFYPYGNIKNWIIKGNVFNFEASIASTNTLLNYSIYKFVELVGNVGGVIQVSNNLFKGGIGSVVLENSTSRTYTNITSTLYLENNDLMGAGNVRMLYVFGDMAASTATVYVRNNRAVAGTLVANTYSGPLGITSSSGPLTGTVTNDDAIPGDVGELRTGTRVAGSATGLATGAASGVCNVALTAGDWDVTGLIDFSLSGATTTNLMGGISTSNTAFGVADTFANIPFTVATLTNVYGQVVPTVRISLAASTVIYLVGQATFSAGTVNAYGTIRARRVR